MFLILAVESDSENFLMLLVLALLRFVLTIAVESESENFLMLLVLASLRVVLSFRQSPRASWITGSKFISKARLVSGKDFMNMERGNYQW